MENLGITNLSKSDLNNKTKAELTKIVKFYKLNGYSKLNKDELVEFIVKFNQSRPGKKISSPKKSLTPKSPPKIFTKNELNVKTKIELQKIVKELGLHKGTSKFNKNELVEFIIKNAAKKELSPKVKEVIISPRIIEKSVPRPREDIEKIFSTIELNKKTVKDLKADAKALGIKGFSLLNKDQLVKALKNKSIKLIPKEGEKKYIRKVGPESNKEKYGLVKILGKGGYGSTYEAVNLDKKEGENDKYAVKVLTQKRSNVLNSYLKEVKCLKDSEEICSQSNILCFKDSFIFTNGKNKPVEYIIVSELLDNYKTLASFLYNNNTAKPFGITKEQALYIYDQVIVAKNAFTRLCIHHSDLHLDNIMIDPKTFKIKVIDLGLCRTPEQEEIELGGKYSDLYKKYSDNSRLNVLKTILYNSSHGSNYVLKLTNDKHNEFFKSIDKKIISPVRGCKRK